MKNRTYRFFTGDPLYPFGHGLSYTTFTDRNLNSTTDISVEVQNTGTRAGEDVVQLYVNHALANFERVSLRPKERKTVHFPKASGEITIGAPK